MSERKGFQVTPLEPEQCEPIIQWVTGGGSQPPISLPGEAWLLAHLDGGITWGHRESGEPSPWKRSSEAFPLVSPQLEAPRLQQLRVFNESREVMLWRSDSGLRGRILEDHSQSLPPYLEPEDREYLLNANRCKGDPQKGFTLVYDDRGARQVVPLKCSSSEFLLPGSPPRRRWPLRLSVRHYLAQDTDTALVRIAASRLYRVWKS